MPRDKVTSGTPWEDVVGYSRTVRVGWFVYVSGTTATDKSGKMDTYYLRAHLVSMA